MEKGNKGEGNKEYEGENGREKEGKGGREGGREEETKRPDFNGERHIQITVIKTPPQHTRTHTLR